MTESFVIDLGEMRVSPLLDATVEMSAALLTGATDEQLRSTLGIAGRSASTGMHTRAFLVQVGSRRILIDAGMGDDATTLMGLDRAGDLTDRLEDLGHPPDSIEEICITHAHFDHVGGLISGDRPRFRNAVVRVPRSDLRAVDETRSEPGSWLAFGSVAAALDLCRAAGQVVVFDDEREREVTDAVANVPLPGHTPGHAGFRIGRGRDSLLFIGDLVVWENVQFPYPDAAWVSDSDPAGAAAQRRRVLGEAADQGFWIAGSHLPSPGIGRVERSAPGYRWVPAT